MGLSFNSKFTMILKTFRQLSYLRIKFRGSLPDKTVPDCYQRSTAHKHTKKVKQQNLHKENEGLKRLIIPMIQFT